MSRVVNRSVPGWGVRGEEQVRLAWGLSVQKHNLKCARPEDTAPGPQAGPAYRGQCANVALAESLPLFASSKQEAWREGFLLGSSQCSLRTLFPGLVLA